MSGTSSDDGEAWSHTRHLIYYVGMRYRSVVISIDEDNDDNDDKMLLRLGS